MPQVRIQMASLGYKMKTETKIYTRTVLAMLFLLSISSACATGQLSLTGGRIRPGAEIPIVAGEQQSGFYQSRDVTVNYSYLRSGGQMQIEGVVRFASHLQFNFTIIPYFNLQLLLADSQGVIVGSRNIGGGSFRSPDADLTFRDRFELPPCAELMAFAYTGQATEGGGGMLGRGRRGGDGVETSFWEYPVIR
jgi:hypothetical protein